MALQRLHLLPLHSLSRFPRLRLRFHLRLPCGLLLRRLHLCLQQRRLWLLWPPLRLRLHLVLQRALDLLLHLLEARLRALPLRLR